MSRAKQLSVCAGVVAHNPHPAELHTLVAKLADCVEWVVVVDNCSEDASHLAALSSHPRVEIIRNTENKGVGGGINQIIQYAREVNAKYVTAYDQDTSISDELVERLVSDLEGLLDSGEPVAAIGPLVIDDFTNHSLPFVHFRFPFNARYDRGLPGKNGLVECHFLISSGCLMSMRALDEVGLMNEALFIDNVDLEWCFRAISKKYKVYGDFRGVIRQRIGEYCTQIPFTNSVIRHHSDGRNYYMTRNRFWLYRQTYVNGAWIFHDLCRFVAKLFYLLIFKEGRLKLLRSSARGIVDSFAMKPYESTNI